MRLFKYCRDKKIAYGDIPLNTRRLKIDGPYDYEIDIHVLPQKIDTIVFNDEYNKKISLNVLPYMLSFLWFGSKYDQKIEKGVLPDTLRFLRFGANYNQPIDLDVLPNSLTNIEYGKAFDQSLIINGKSVLPNNLDKVCFGNENTIINHNAFSYKTHVYIETYTNQIEITYYIRALKEIDAALPMPIAEEIILHIEMSHIRNNDKNDKYDKYY